MKSDVADFVQSKGDEVEITESGKIRFVVSGMEFPTTVSVEVLNAHFSGRAMRRARVERANEQYNFAEHLPHIVPHKFMNKEKFLFCYLTSSTLPRNAEIVERHVNGKKYKRKLKESLEKKAELDRIKERRKAKAEKAKESRQKQKEAVKNGKIAAGKDDSEMDANGEGAGDADALADEEVVHPEDSDADMQEGEGESEERLNGDAFANAVNNGFAGEAESLLADTLSAALADSEAESDDNDDNEEGEENDEEMDEGNFWTRGRQNVQKPSKKVAKNDIVMKDDDSDDDEWKTKKKSKAKRKRALARASVPAATAGSKRKRAPLIPKKARQARQRRNSGGAPPAAAIAAGN